MPETVQIYKSSAGSGKTYTLVREYLSHALGSPDRYRQLLAITFTNKAAAEMKERIIKALKELSTDQNPRLATAISEINGLALPLIKTNAGIILSYILHDYAHFAVSTIDSFTSRIVKQFAKDLELPSRYDVESDTTMLLEKMVDRLMDQVGRDDYITQILVSFSEEKLAEQGSWNLDKDLNSVSRQIFDEGSRPFLEKIKNLEGDKFIAFMADIKEKVERFKVGMIEKAERVIALLNQFGLNDEDFAGGRNSVAKQVRLVPAAKKPRDFSDFFTKSYVKKALEQGEYLTKTKKNPQVEAALEKGLRAAFEDAYHYYETHFGEYVSSWYAYRNIHSLGVLQQVEEFLEDYKAQNSLVHISDFQRKISHFIQSESADYIYWRLGERYKYFLLDEFQDTSELQWKNLFPLFDNLLSQSEPDGNVMLVGDSKQAIYRWRGGEVELLELTAPRELNTEPYFLDTNWRSGEHIVEFNNVFFNTFRDLYPQNDLVQVIYHGFHQHFAPHHGGLGYVKLHGITDKKFKETALAETLAAIEQVVSDGYSYSDIAILVRAKDEGSTVARMLADHDIPVISSESLQLYKEPAVAFMVNVLKYLSNPSDAVARASMLHYKLFYLDTEAPVADGILDFDRPILEDAPLPYLPFESAVRAEKPFEAFREQMPEEFRKLQFRLDRIPLYELVEEIVRIFGLNKLAQTYVQQFLDVVLDFTNRRRADLDGFLDYWNDQKDSFSISVPQGLNAIEILTIHKSKGLEFPVVIMPFANWELSPKSFATIWAESSQQLSNEGEDAFLVTTNKDLEGSFFSKAYESELDKTLLDNMNMLYVAFTRPRERLYVFYGQKAEKANPKKGAENEAPDLKRIGDVISEVRKRALDSSATQVSESYERGMELPPHEPRQVNPASFAEELLSIPWEKRIRMERKHKKHWGGNLTKLAENPMAIPLETVSAEALRRIDTEQDLTKVLKDLVEEGLLKTHDHISLSIKLKRILSDSHLGQWYAPDAQIRREAEILTEDAELYHPSRLRIEGSKALLLDFLVQDEAEDLRKIQKAYAKNLRKMGFKQVELYIFDLGTETFLPQ